MAVLSLSLAALGDVFGRTLRGLLAACVLGAAAVLALGVWAADHFLLPLLRLPDSGWGRFLAGLADLSTLLIALALTPIVAYLIGAVLFDAAALRVERRIGLAPLGRAPSLGAAIAAGLRIGGPALLGNVVALILLFIPGLGLFLFAAITAWLAAREFFTLAALRFGDWRAARHLRRRHWLSVNLAGLVLAGLMITPVISLITPLFAAALMTRLRARLAPG